MQNVCKDIHIVKKSGRLISTSCAHVRVHLFYCIQEQIFDYLFSNLGINTDGQVPHPILLTEPAANPNFCRQRESLNSNIGLYESLK